MTPRRSCRVGVGLRPAHYARLAERPRTAVGWFEAVSENYMDSSGKPLAALEAVRRDHPVALHGVSMSVGSVGGAGGDYLRRLKALADRVDPFLVSDHLCWTGLPGRNLHDLLPLPFTREAARRAAGAAARAQDFLGRPLALENVSSYLSYPESEMPEWEFLTLVARKAGCGILLDVNNVFVNARNHGFDPAAYLDAIPAELVAQIHLAGHSDLGGFLFDDHGSPVAEPVWELYSRVIRRLPDVPVLIEWDENVPSFPELEAQAAKAAALWDEHHAQKPSRRPAEALR